MRRTLAVSLVPAVVVAAAWLRLEQPRDELPRAAALAALALAPALVRPLALRAAGVVVAAVVAARLAFHVPVLHPWRFAPRFATGFLDFYDVRVPFDPRVQVEMGAVVLTAIFGFTLVVTLAVAARRPLVATLLLLLGAGWPATLAGPTGGVVRGVALLLGILVVLAGLTQRRIPATALPAVALLALVAALASSSSAVAKGELVAWQRWDFYNAPVPPVSVAYVWDAQYGGVRFPARRTTVLKIHAPARSLFWRAAVLDQFAGDRWLQTLPQAGDALEPRAARDRTTWVRQDVTVEALSDTRLVGASVPVGFAAGDAPLVRPGPGLALLPSGLTRGFRYTAWSYEPRPTPAGLARSPATYPSALAPFLEVWPGVRMPAFGTPGRPQAAAAVLDAHPEIERYVPLARAAADVAGEARTPYAAALALDAWFRVGGGFTYTNRPAVYAAAPLVGFVAQTRAGYCQYFAGAMALMLRYLGVPARVAVGFSSGTYDPRSHTWTVTDHDAHAWVEAWFRGFGWLPFDPTPAAGRPERGALPAPFSAERVRGAGRGGGAVGAQKPTRQSAHRHGEGTATPTVNAGPAASSAGGSAARSLLELLALVVAAAAVALVAAKGALRRARFLTRDPRRVAAACRHELAGYLLDQRVDAARSATLHELGALVRAEFAVDPSGFVATATAARFGPPAGAPEAARRARRELRALLRGVRRQLRARERACGLFSLRSLGFVPGPPKATRDLRRASVALPPTLPAS